MKTVSLFVAVFACVVLAGCVGTEEALTAGSAEPRSYNETMDWMRDDIRTLNRQITGGNYGQAVKDARRVRDNARRLGTFEPPRINRTYEAYKEFDKQTEDLYRTSDRLLYYIEQRHRSNIREQLVELASRYNRLARNYGPAHQVSVLDRSPTELEDEPVDVSEMPDELRLDR